MKIGSLIRSLEERFAFSDEESEIELVGGGFGEDKTNYAKSCAAVMQSIERLENVEWARRDKRRLEEVARSMVVTMRDWSRDDQAKAKDAAGEVEVKW